MEKEKMINKLLNEAITRDYNAAKKWLDNCCIKYPPIPNMVIHERFVQMYEEVQRLQRKRKTPMIAKPDGSVVPVGHDELLETMRGALAEAHRYLTVGSCSTDKATLIRELKQLSKLKMEKTDG